MDQNPHDPNTSRAMLTSVRARYALAALVGALAGLGQAPWDIWAATIAALFVLLALVTRAESSRQIFATQWVFALGYFGVALSWLVEPFLVDIARHGWMAPFALFFMAGGLGLFWGASALIARRVAGEKAFPFAWAGALAGAELARGYVLTGFPWALIGHVWIDTPVLAFAPLLGPNGMTLATLFLVAALFSGLRQRRRSTWLVAPTLFLVLVGLGTLIRPNALPIDPEAPVVRLVQPNAPQDEKWDPDHVLTFFRRQLAFTASEQGPPPDLVIWPETAIPWRLSDADQALQSISSAAGGAPVAVGVQRRDQGIAHNSMVVTNETGGVGHLYDKHHLVPFGEFIPLGGLARLIGLQSFAAQDGFGFTSGPGARVLDLGPLGHVLPLICYEAIFPQDLRAAPRRPDWLMQITNDAWFGQVSGPFQHLAQARLRAAEQGLPMMRVGNTGVSAVIDSEGRVLAEIPLGEAGYLDHALPPARDGTLYARFGDGPIAVLILLILGVSGTARYRKSH